MANYTFKGTAVTGTSERYFRTPGAKVNDTYLNTQTGHTYVCREVSEDNKNNCKWAYHHTIVIAKPDMGVKKLSKPARSAYKMTSKWEIPEWLKNSQNGSRATEQNITWTVKAQVNKKDKKLSVTKDIGVGSKQSSINLDSFKVGKKTYTRDSFYPVGDLQLKSVSFTVQPTNSKGEGPKETSSRKFLQPKKPTITGPTFDPETGRLTFGIKTDAGTGYRERYDTWYKMTVVDTLADTTKTVFNESSRSTDFTIYYDARDYREMDHDDYIKVTVETWARGFWGNSKHTKKTYYISFPAQASILKTDITSEDTTGRCIVKINTNKQTKAHPEHPVDRVKLEYLPNVTYASEGEIPGEEGPNWKSTGIIDNADCTALSVSVTELIPEKGKYTWLRVKSWHVDENSLYRYSAYVNVLHKEAPTAEDEEIAIISAVPGNDGKSIVVTLGWNANGQDDATGTEISWSDELDTWESTKDPESYMFTWYRAEDVTGPDGTVYHSSATITIKGLQEGERYYIKARRYLDGDVTTYSKYSDYAVCATNEIPESVVMTVQKFVAIGSSLPVYWTFSGNGIQTSWQVTAFVEGADTPAVLASGEGSTGFAQIPAETFETHAVDGLITIRAEASTGSDFKSSEWATVQMVSAPEVTIDIASTLTAQPLEFDVTASAPCSLLIIVSSEGAESQFPVGMLRQTEGDTIYSDLIEAPEWGEVIGGYETTIRLPEGLDFWDNGNYELTVSAIDNETGLRTDLDPIRFAVDWTNKAVDPFEAVTVTPIDTIDEDTGAHIKAVEIALTPPDNSGQDDVYDIYRLSGDGAQLIGRGFPLGQAADPYITTDMYAPFGDDMTLYYRIAIRTPDGDVEYADFEYNADGNYIRLDWDSYSLELPYDITIADSYEKSVDIRQHMDGSTDGYWNQNIQRKGTLATDVIRLEQANEIALARQLGRYPGVVFVRTPDGSAYEADVQVTDLSAESKHLASIALDATEVGLTQEFMLPIPFDLEEEEEE